MFYKITDFLLDIFSKITWRGLRKLITGRSHNIDSKDKTEIIKILKTGYFIILTEDRSHLSSWMVKIGHFLLTGKWAKFTHALVNVEGDKDVKLKFVEAIGKGVKLSYFKEVFECDSVCILKPRYYTIEEFDAAVGSVYAEIGKKYDKRFKVNDPLERSCVEIARVRMQRLPNYYEKMRIFEYMIENEKNLTPQMFRDCPDFEVLLEIRK